jgi:murein DD-endopeptidase MepM/ murein hydrolase activator NlpD
LPLARASAEVLPVDKLQAGQPVRLRIRDNTLQALEYDLDANRFLRWERKEGRLTAELHTRPRIHQTRTAYGRIRSSLFAAGDRAGLSERLTMELAQIFGWDIDFAHELRQGDWFRVLYRVALRDGKRIADGPILAAQFYNHGEVHHAIRFTNASGEADYYTLEGRSVRKAFLRSPVKFSRITSGFSPNRDHPILGERRAHRGVDYAARTGTPVRATGDGRVRFRGQRGGFGRVVTLRHFNRFTTVYAHLSGFASGLREGETVEQGETIGYVGQSGLATGPHLHYEFRVRGRHRDPLHVDLPRAAALPQKFRDRFRERRHHLLAWLATAGPQQLAALPDADNPS